MDAVDKEWHLTSPTPYDPPLTYGGWTQGRALGARIASLLKAREDASDVEQESSASLASSSTGETTASHDNASSKPPRKVRKHNVIIHTSPFLRCIQTSIAIGAGISQFHRSEYDHSLDHTPVVASTPVSEDISPTGTPLPLRSSTPMSSTDQVGRHGSKDRISNGRRVKIAPRTKLRIDAFLGEWLSPDYFEQITPPPGSLMMVASAKAELLRRGEMIHRANNTGSNSFSGNFPGGWRNNSSPTADTVPEKSGLGMSSLAEALPHDGHTGGDNSSRPTGPVKPITIRDVLSRSPSHAHEDFSAGYIPPVPTYAISPSGPIPTGYVAHARDACIDVDYQWDSMREPQNWGDGGEYDEEWSAMHKRFRTGLLKMIDWYSHEKVHGYHRHHHHHHHHSEEDENDTVLVLVTHGAGCNALIGAMTNQPVLIDVAMASLTMAVRKDIVNPRLSYSSSKDTRDDAPSTMPLSQIYDLSLVASTEHLRITSNPLSIPQLPVPTPERVIPAYRHRAGSNPMRFAKNGLELNRTARSHVLQRSATVSSSHNYQAPRSVSGLWASKDKENSIEEIPSYQFEQRDTVQHDQPVSEKPRNEAMSPTTNAKHYQSTFDDIPEHPKTQLGLWDSAAIAHTREPAVKRRWTMTERQRP